MDEMGPRLDGFVSVIMVMLALMAVVLALWAAWRGWRWTRRGETRGALIVTNALVLINAVSLALVVPYALTVARNPTPWIWLFVTLPPLAGYVLGSSAGLLTSRRHKPK